MPEVIDISQAHLPSLLERVCKGEEFILTHEGRPCARLVPLERPKKRRLGAMKGLGRVDPAFFEPLPMEELEAWG